MSPAINTSATFSALHIDIARHATDDFNPFHDKARWQRIDGNPFKGPIALGFQSIAFIDHALRQFRTAHDETSLIDKGHLHFSNLDVTFASAITADQPVDLEIRPSAWSEEKHRLRNRIVMRSGGRIVLTGHKTESQTSLLHVALPLSPERLSDAPDRSFIDDGSIFVKRKFMMTSNAKNFLASSCVEPAVYFDEIVDHVEFPECYPLSLISCALLERGMQSGHDFMREPMVYAYHRFATDRRVLRGLRSNDRLIIAVGIGETAAEDTRHPGLVRHQCAAYLANGAQLYQAEIGLRPLVNLTN